MIESLDISHLGVIANAHVDFGPGLVVVTGETGAGKTMVLSSLQLLLGARAMLRSFAVARSASRWTAFFR